MNNKDIYNYYMKKVYNEDIGLALEIGKHFLVKGATDIASKYTGLDYGDATTKKDKKENDLKSAPNNTKINLTEKFKSITSVPYSIFQTPKEFLKYIILEYMLISTEDSESKYFIERNSCLKKDSQTYKIFILDEGLRETKKDKQNEFFFGELLFEKLKSNGLEQFIKKNNNIPTYIGTNKIIKDFDSKYLNNILNNINQNALKKSFSKRIESVYYKKKEESTLNTTNKQKKSIVALKIEHSELVSIYDSDLESQVFMRS